MKKLGNIQKSFFEMAQILAQNEKLQRLLVVDNNDPYGTTFDSLTMNELLEQKYICVIPPFLEEGIENSGRNSFLTIRFDDIDLEDTNGEITVRGSVVFGTHENCVLLKGNKSRLLEILEQIVDSLQDKKLSSAGKIDCTYATAIDFSPYTIGYRLSFSFADLSNRKAEL